MRLSMQLAKNVAVFVAEVLRAKKNTLPSISEVASIRNSLFRIQKSTELEYCGALRMRTKEKHA